MASTIWLIFCAVSVWEREGLAGFGDGGEVVGVSAVEPVEKTLLVWWRLG